MLQRAIFEGFKNLTRTIWLSVTAISVLTVSFGSVALIAIMSTTVSYTVDNLDNLITIRALISDKFPEERIPELVTIIESLDGVNSQEVRYFDKEMSKEDFLESNKDTLGQNLLDSFTGDIFFRFIQVVPEKPEDYGLVIQGMNEITINDIDDIWEQIPKNQELVDNLKSVNRFIRIVVVALVIVFASISILVMANILRITIYSHREEIEIMRLVGATNNYIRMPFVAEGVYYNLISATIVILVFVPLLGIILPQIQRYILGTTFAPSAASDLGLQIYLTIGATLIFGTLIGVLTSYLTIQRYLKL